jgi:hypothetical protein
MLLLLLFTLSQLMPLLLQERSLVLLLSLASSSSPRVRHLSLRILRTLLPQVEPAYLSDHSVVSKATGGVHTDLVAYLIQRAGSELHMDGSGKEEAKKDEEEVKGEEGEYRDAQIVFDDVAEVRMRPSPRRSPACCA